MKDFDANIFSVNDVINTLKECEANERFEGVYLHMLSFASELTGLSEDALLESMDEKRSNRLDALRKYQDNEATLKNAAMEEKRNKTNALISEIQALKPRIDELIATGNACVQNNIPMTGHAFGMREGYDTNQFFTNSWSHLVGFVGNPDRRPCHIEYLGINAGGACGSYDFRTDGERVFSVHEKKPTDVIAPSIEDMKHFLKRFDEFESSFYAYVDKVIQKQQNSVDKLIASAQEKASKQNTSKMPEKEHISDR